MSSRVRLRLPRGAKVRKLGRLFDTKVWLVNGEVIRGTLSVDFTMGDNWKHSPKFVPKGELWVEQILGPLDRTATIIHEYVEVQCMCSGIDYETAHDWACHHEKRFRASSRPHARYSPLSKASDWLRKNTTKA